MDSKNIIVIGASAGGISAVNKLVGSFNGLNNVAIFIVIHISADSNTSILLGQLQKNAPFPCLLPVDNQILQHNTIYLAPADYHMMISENRILVKRGPYENHWRPAIDVLFRSAAASYGNCVTGIILTGMLDDGTSGMSAIQRAGGMLMVQDPAEAEYEDMPVNVLRNMDVDYSLPLAEMPMVLIDHYLRLDCDHQTAPDDVRLEAQITQNMSSDVEELKKIGSPTTLTCPDCGGSLMKIKNEKEPRYRCYTGHSFSALSLEQQQLNNIESSIWVAIRMMEERRNLLNNLAKNEGNIMGRLERAQDMVVHIDRLKEMLLNLHQNGDKTSS